MIAPTDRTEPVAELVDGLAEHIDHVRRYHGRLRQRLRAGPRDRRLERLARQLGQLAIVSQQLVDRATQASAGQAVPRDRIEAAARELAADPILAGGDYRCAYCGRDLLGDVETFSTISRDHIVPKSLGGPHGPRNRVPSCCACDRLKSGAAVENVADARAVIARRREFRTAVLEHVRQLVGRDP